jgi:hypothetical protein
MFRKTWVGLIAALALAASGCGGSTNSSAGSGASGAQVVPASAPVFASIDTDLSSDQWKSVQSLLDKFPSKDLLLGQLQQSFEKDANGITWSDVKAALGPELDIAVLDLGHGNSDVVGLTQPNDTAKFDALIQKANANATSPSDKLYVVDYQGWKVFSDSQARLAAFKQAADTGTPLADDSSYKAASAKLADSSLVQVYANGAQLPTTFTSAAQGFVGDGKLVWAAAELVSEDDGLELDAFAQRAGGTAQTPADASKLLDVVPSGALVFASFDGSGFRSAALRNALPQGSLPQARDVLGMLGKLGDVFGSQNALYVLPGAGIPEVTLVTVPDSPDKASAALDDLVSSLGLSGSAAPRPVTIDGVQAKALDLGRITIYWGVQDGRLVVSNSQEAFSELSSGGQKLADDPTFKEAQDASGLPSSTSGLLYVNLKDSIPQVVSLAQLGGASIPPQVMDNLRPLRTLIGWSAIDGSQTSGTLFLEVK